MPFNPFSLLMGQQMSSMAPMPGEDPPILVTAPQERPTAERMLYEDAPAREPVTPRYVLNDNRIAPNQDELDEILPRQGMFGVKGTLRDVLGTLGDAFLTQAGRDTVYRPQRLREQMGDAMFGAAQDPYQAAERLAAGGFTKEAQDLITETQRNEYNRGMLASTEGSRQDQARNRREDNTTILRNLTARRLQAAGENPEAIAYALELAQQDATRLGIDLADLGIRPNMSPAQRGVVAGGDMSVNQQQTLPLARERVEIAGRNADSYEYSVHNRNPPPRPRADTDQEYYRQLSEVPENERTPEQRNWIKMYIEGRDGRSSRIPATPPPPSNAQPSRFRIIR